MPVRLGLGTATLLSGYGLDATVRVNGAGLIHHAIDRGIDYIDTAAVYADSERTIGGLANLVRARRVDIATKLTAAELLAGGLDPTLARLRQPAIDTLLLHSATAEDITNPSVAARMTSLVDTGAIRRAGASTYGVLNARLALAQSWCSAVQVEFSILNPSVLRGIQDVRRKGQQVAVRSVFCKGLLTPRRSAAPVPPAAGETLNALETLASRWSMTLPELALRYALDTPGVDVVVIGASNTAEIDSAIAVRDRQPLDAAQMEALGAFDRSAEAWTHPETWAA